MTIHKPDDKVNYNSNKTVWIEFDRDEDKNKFFFRRVPYMSSGKHIPRYKNQFLLQDVYMNHKENIANKLVEYGLLEMLECVY